MNKKSLLALLMALLMLVLTGCSSAVVTAGKMSYTKEEVQAAAEELVAYYEQMGQIYLASGYGYNPYSGLTADNQDVLIEAAMTLGQEGILLTKAAELGLDKLTDEEIASLGEDTSESAKNIKIMEKLQAHVIKDVTVTDEELQAELDARAEQAKADYADNAFAYGDAVNGGVTTYYAPAGYRFIKQILVQYTEEDQAKVEAALAPVETAQETFDAAQAAAAAIELPEGIELAALLEQVTVVLNDVAEDGAVTVKESTPAFEAELDETAVASVKALAEAKAVLDAYTAKKDEVVAAAQAAIKAEAEEVLAAAQAEGADWDALAAEHNDDPGMMEGRKTAETGYAVCKDYEGFIKEFYQGAMNMANVGDVELVPADAYGYHILKYVGDSVEGAVALEAVAEELKAELLPVKQSEFYNAEMTKWTNEIGVDIKLHELLK